MEQGIPKQSVSNTAPSSTTRRLVYAGIALVAAAIGFGGGAYVLPSLSPSHSSPGGSMGAEEQGTSETGAASIIPADIRASSTYGFVVREGALDGQEESQNPDKDTPYPPQSRLYLTTPHDAFYIGTVTGSLEPDDTSLVRGIPVSNALREGGVSFDTVIRSVNTWFAGGGAEFSLYSERISEDDYIPGFEGAGKRYVVAARLSGECGPGAADDCVPYTDVIDIAEFVHHTDTDMPAVVDLHPALAHLERLRRATPTSPQLVRGYAADLVDIYFENIY